MYEISLPGLLPAGEEARTLGLKGKARTPFPDGRGFEVEIT